MKKYLLIFAFIMPLFTYAQPFEAELLGHWSNDDLIPTSWLDSRYNDVWGTVQNGQEFAIFGSTEGVHFIDVTDPTNPTEVAFVEAAAIGNQLVHRDYHTYNGYLYTVADEGPSTLQVIDMHDLPNSVDLVYDSNEFMTRSHNIFVDSLNAVLYSCGGDSGNSLRLLSLADPTTPTFLTEYSFNTPFSIPQVHDIYVRDHIGYLNCGNFGFFIIDFSNPTDPVLLGTMTDYPQKGYNHSGWLANDEQHYYMCDETHGMDVKVVDVSDPSDLNVVNLFSAESTPNQIAHNAIVRDNYLYISYYYDGVQVFDITDPANPVRFSYFDTFDGANDSFYQGAWGVYPFLPSGNILISDMNNGLYVVNPFSQGFTLSGVPSSVDICTKNDINFELTVSNSFEDMVDLSITNLPSGAEVIFSQNPASPGSVVEVTITNITEAGSFSPEISATDGENVVNSNFEIEVTDLLAASSLELPQNESEEIELKPLFTWAEVDDAENYKIAIATDEMNFNGSIIFSTSVPNTEYQLLGELDENQTYYWRVSTSNECGDSHSTIFSFTTEFTSSLFELEGNAVSVFPNPTSSILNVEFELGLEKEIQVELVDLSGTLVQNQRLGQSQKNLILDLENLSNGVYFLRLTSENGVLTEKILIQK